MVVSGFDVIGVEVVPEHEPAGDRSLRPLIDEDGGALGRPPRTFRLDRQLVALDRQVDRVGIEAGQVEVEEEPVVETVGIDRHHRRPRPPHLLGEPIEIGEWIETHQHDNPSFVG